MGNKQITIAVFELDDKAKDAVLQSGGRAQIATTACAGAEDYSDAASIYIVTLPANAEVHRALYQNHYDVAVYPEKHTEITLDLCLRPEETSLKFVEAFYDFDTKQGGDE